MTVFLQPEHLNASTTTFYRPSEILHIKRKAFGKPNNIFISCSL